MPSPTPEARAKIAAKLRRYYADPAALAKISETARKGGRATTARKAELEAEVVRLQAEVARLRAELARLSGTDPATSSQPSRKSDSPTRADARPETSEVTGDPTTGRGDISASLRTPDRGRTA